MTIPKRLSSHDALVEAAFEVFARNPGAPLAEVAERAGVGRATLHRLFSSREDLVRTLAQRAVSEMDEAAEAAARDVESYGEALRRTLGAIIPLGNRYSFLSREPLEDDPTIAAEFERQMAQVHEAVEGAKREGVFDATVPTSWIVQTYDHLIYAAWESVHAGSATPDQAAELAWRTITSGLGGPK